MPLALRRALCFCLFLLAGSLGAQTTFSTVVVFGDSLSDTGNIAHLTQSASAGVLRYPSDMPALGLDYTNGRFTDGKDTQPAASAYGGVWIEQLAASFAAKPAVIDSLDGGTNYAYGDATTANSTTTVSEGPVSITLHNMGQQLADYLGQSPAPVPTAGTLYVLWGGSNDIYQAVAAAATAGTSTTTAATTAATTAVTNEVGYIQQLIAKGATNFLVVNVPPLGIAPNYAGTSTATALNTGSAVFAGALPTALASVKTASAARGITVNFYQTDVFSQFAGVATNYMLVGLSNVTTPAQNVTGSPDTYLIWDGVHPTTTGHHLVAELAANLFTPLVDSVSTLSVPAAVVAGQTVTLSAKVTPQASSAAIPTGLVTFFNGTALLGSGTLNATGTVSATFTAAGTAPYAVTAIYSGDTTYGYSASAVSAISVLTAPVTTTTSLAASATTAPALTTSITFTATVTPAVSTFGLTTGSVTFFDGTTVLASSPVTNNIATYVTNSLAAGTHNITASYIANGIFGGSTSTAIPVTIGTPGFTPAATPTSITITDGSSGTTAVSVTPSFGYTGTVTLACGTLPAHVSCAFSTTTLTVSGTSASAAATLTLATNASAALTLPPRPGATRVPETVLAGLFLPALGGLLWGAKRRRRLPTLLALLALLGVSSMGLAGCGSSSNSNATRGTYTVPVTFTASGAAAQTLNLSVVIQ